MIKPTMRRPNTMEVIGMVRSGGKHYSGNNKIVTIPLHSDIQIGDYVRIRKLKLMESQ